MRIIIGTSTTLAYSIMPAHCQMVVCVCGSSWDTHHGTRGATISMLSGGAATSARRSSCDERVPVRIGMDIECLPEKRRSARVEMWQAAAGRMIQHSPRNSAGNTFRHQSARERYPDRRENTVFPAVTVDPHNWLHRLAMETQQVSGMQVTAMVPPNGEPQGRSRNTTPYMDIYGFRTVAAPFR